MAAQQPPEDILDAVKVIKQLRDKQYLTREEKTDIHRAKLRVAYWACRSENIVASRENLAYVLGKDAEEIMGAYDRYLENADKKSGKPRGKGDKDKTNFWGGA